MGFCGFSKDFGGIGALSSLLAVAKAIEKPPKRARSTEETVWPVDLAFDRLRSQYISGRRGYGP